MLLRSLPRFWRTISSKIFTLFLALTLAVIPATAQLSTDSRIGPTAHFTASPSFVPVGATVTLDASPSRDSRGGTALEYRWHFGELGTGFTEWTRSPAMTKVYGSGGQARIRLQVRDADGFIDETVFSVEVRQFTGDQRPWAAFSVSPEAGDTETQFTFTVQAFSNINTPTRDLEVRWDWNRDGTWDTPWSTARVFTHTFPNPGYREVWLEVRDPVNGQTNIEKGFYVVGEEDDSARNRVIGRIFVEQSTRPQASFRHWPTTGLEPGQIVHFDAVASLRAAFYRWDFDGDGRFDTAWLDKPALMYQFEKAGQYEITLETKNENAEIDRTSRTIVIDPARGGPVASLRIGNTASPADGTLGLLSETFSFDASGSRDTDGRSADLSYRFDFDGDGRFDTTFSADPRATHRYAATGEYRPVVEVRDNRGFTSRADAYLRVVENTPPTISLAASAAAVLAGNPITFTATVADGQTKTSDLLVRFDFENNGSYDTPWQRTTRVTHRFDRAGHFLVVAEVKDRANAVTRTTLPIRVAAVEAPVAQFSISPRVGVTAETVQFDASRSFDSTGLAGPLQYRWNFAAMDSQDITFSTSWSTSPRASYRYRTPGGYLVHLAVKNSAGEIADLWDRVTISEASEDMQYLVRKRVISSYNPAAPLTRAELSVMLVAARGLRLATPTMQPFPDVSREDWYAAAALHATRHGWLSPRSNFDFDGGAQLRRAEAARAIVAALFPGVPSTSSEPVFSDVPVASPFQRVARVVAAYDLAPEPLFRPHDFITRAEASRMIARLLREYERGGSFAASILSVRSFFIR